MKLKLFLEKINEMIAKDALVLGLEVIYSKDDEGNGYQKIVFHPCVGVFNEDDGEFDNDFEQNGHLNAICIN